ncbi:DUF2911 domain-containing protein [Jiulongibacter sp. NS-SX5]|uniref:DUF2911 domain-containing protein n=1 Tax=Jiulongibacter sp. NS-SX5 TaxID=3463854 RepID=UPI004058BF31
MKKFVRIILIVIAVLAALFFGLKSWTKSHSPAAVVEQTSGDLNVKVKYCQPAVKGRTIFGELVPFNKVWRTGANEATLISFSRDVNFAGADVPMGEYTLWTIPTESDWTVILNSQTGQWGTSYNESEDFVRVQVPSMQTAESQELFTINTSLGSEDEVILNLHWANTAVDIPVK